ncbi:vacuolar import and degradation [Tubulinosema ratisbonensis]|uniref:Vacuolar import and degradation n=1 Tax=Tubulinosema ratisbonensis TaxID=291195 RepID=A0A437AMG8_9MICR|nr:vacuolar import and degradation [Tubulinosema ratisbonensis]
MFNFLKRNSAEGELFCSSQKLFDCKYTLTKDTLIFTSLKEERSFQLKKMYNLTKSDDKILFSYFSEDYSFLPKKPVDLFDELNKFVSKTKQFECIVNLSVYENGRFRKEGEKNLEIKENELILGENEINVNLAEIIDFYYEKKDCAVIISYFVKREKIKQETLSLIFNSWLILLKFLTFVQVKEKEEFYESSSEEISQTESENEILEEKVNENEKKNDNLLVKDDLLFVSRGEALGIFDTKNDLKFKETITNALEDSLSKMKLYNNNLILQDKDTQTLKILDLNLQKITEKRDTAHSLNDFFTEKEFLGGITKNKLLNFDLRSKNVVVNQKEYKTNPDFSIGNIKDSQIVVGSSNGDIRIYDCIGKRAKELIKGYGGKPTYVDILGKYILVTCDEYLLFIFDKKSVKLSLKPHHISFLKNKIHFTPGKFSSDGKRIVTSTNNYVVVWNVSDVLKENTYSYRIKQFNDDVVANSFAGNDSNTILLALPDDVKKTGTNSLWSLEKEIYKRK